MGFSFERYPIVGKTPSNSIACYRYITGVESTNVASCIVVLLKKLPQSPQRLLNMNKFCEVFHSSGRNKIHMHILAMKYGLYNLCYSSYTWNATTFAFKNGIEQNKYEQ